MFWSRSRHKFGTNTFLVSVLNLGLDVFKSQSHPTNKTDFCRVLVPVSNDKTLSHRSLLYMYNSLYKKETLKGVFYMGVG